MTRSILRSSLLLALALMASCASATDRLNDGIALQSQGRYVQAVYRYAEAVEKDPALGEAQDRLLASADSAMITLMYDADQLEVRGDPVQAAGLYATLDQMQARVRQVGLRVNAPADYATTRRNVFDNAIHFNMTRGYEAKEVGRWDEARAHFAAARANFLPSREQVETSYEAETDVLLDWAAIELEDDRPRAAFEIAEQALTVRQSPARKTVLAVRDLQDEALAAGTVVVAVVPVMAEPPVRDWLGGEFEVQLDADLGLDHWTRPPAFVEMADPLILRNELRGLLRGQGLASPLLVGRALDLIGADLGIMVRLTEVDVVEEGITRAEHQAIVPRNIRQGARRTTVMDTVPYFTVSGTLRYYVEADILLVDPSGREVNRFSASSEEAGPFQRGEFDGDPADLDLDGSLEAYFDPAVIGGQMASIEDALREQLAVAIAAGTYDQVVLGIR